jgi:plasmid maintenance system antidote protein VapI
MDLDHQKIKFYLEQDLVEREISQTKQAAYIGVSQATINRICNGERDVGVKVLTAICQYFGKTPDFFYNFSGKAQPLAANDQ